MLIDLNDKPEQLILEADVCIAGAGAAGITIAIELAKANINVILLEGGGKTYTDESQDLYKGGSNSLFYPKLDSSRLRYLGGTTNHWEGSCRTLSKIDFEKRDWVPNSGWPITKSELDPFYKRAHNYCELGVYDYSIEYWEKHSHLKRTITAESSFETHVNQSSPPTRFGQKYLPYLTNSKNVTLVLNANVTNINESKPIGKISGFTIKNHQNKEYTATADNYIIAMGGLENSRILLLSREASENGLGNENDMLGRYYMDHPGVKMAAVVPTKNWAKSVVMGENLKNQPPRGVAWTLELSEKTLREKKLCNARIAMAERNKLFLSKGVESVHQLKKAYGENIDIDSYFEHIENIIYDWDLVAESIGRKEFNTYYSERAKEFGGYLANAMTEQHPDYNNRITLSDKKDKLGLNKIKLHWKVTNQDKENIKKVVDELAHELSRLRLARVRSLVAEDETDRIFEELLSYGYHHMGGTRMSDDPKNGVVDSQLKIHNRKNIYVAGSSVFPTGGHVTPTLTIVALAIRLADHLIKEKGKS